MPEELKPVSTPAPAPNDAPAPAADPSAPPAVAATDGQPQPKPELVAPDVVLPGNVRQPQDWNDPSFRNEVAENYWKIKTYDTADERRLKRAARKDRDLLMAALRGEKDADHPLAEEIREFFKTVQPPPVATAPAPAGSLFAALDSDEVKEELEGSPVLAKALAGIKAADEARTQQFAKIAADYKALLDSRIEGGESANEPLDQAEVFNLQSDIRDLTRTPHGKSLCEKISQEMYGVKDVRRGAGVLAQEFAELIRERAKKGEADPDFMKDVVEAEMRSYNISPDAAPAPKPEQPKPTPPPVAGDLPPGGKGTSPDESDTSKLTPDQQRERARARFDGAKPTKWDKMEPGGTEKFRRRMAESGIK